MLMRIRELRVAANITQKELADRVGATQGIVSSWETETFLPKTRDLPLLAKALSCDISELFIGEPAPAEDSA